MKNMKRQVFLSALFVSILASSVGCGKTQADVDDIDDSSKDPIFNEKI